MNISTKMKFELHKKFKKELDESYVNEYDDILSPAINVMNQVGREFHIIQMEIDELL